MLDQLFLRQDQYGLSHVLHTWSGVQGPVTGEPQQQGLESQREMVRAQLDSFCEGGWQLTPAYTAYTAYTAAVAQLQDCPMYI